MKKFSVRKVNSIKNEYELELVKLRQQLQKANDAANYYREQFERAKTVIELLEKKAKLFQTTAQGVLELLK
jgi:hypothetical protein